MEKKLIGSHTVLYIGGGDSGWLTQSYATCYRTFHKEIILADATKESDWTEWTAAQKQEWESNSPTPAQRNDFTIDAEDAGAVLNDSTGYYELNTLTDITESQMRTILAYADSRNEMYGQSGCLRGRTNIPGDRRRLSPHTENRLIGWCDANQDIEILCLTDGSGTWWNSIIRCPKLRIITSGYFGGTVWDFYASNETNLFWGCPLLEEFRINNINKSVKLAVDSPKLSYATVQYAIQHCITTAKTFTVHPAVYAKLNDEANEEWHALLALAESKNITFATTS